MLESFALATLPVHVCVCVGMWVHLFSSSLPPKMHNECIVSQWHTLAGMPVVVCFRGVSWWHNVVIRQVCGYAMYKYMW